MNKKIKLYIFSPYSFIGGDTLSISRLIANLDTKNYDISFICLKKTKILNYLKKKKFKIIRTNTTRTIFSIFDIIKIIKKDLKKKYKKYIFLSNQNFANIVSVIFKLYFRKKIKLILIERNHLDEFKYQKSFKNFFIKRLLKYTYIKADLIVGISKKLSKDLSKYIKKKVVTIYNPSFDKEVYKLSKKKINIKKNKNLILSVGRFENQKDPFTLLKAFKLVRERINCNLMMIGFGSMFNEMNKFVIKNKLKNNVKILSNINNPFPYYKISKIFVLHSKYEGFGNVLVEAAMFKIPIISSNCNSGPKEILLNGKGGILFKVGDYKDLSKKIIFLLTHKNTNSKKILFNSLKRFNIEQITSNYNKIFKKI